VWLPASGWNGKFLGVGNGGWAGTIGYAALAAGVAGGYAAVGTDTGHAGNTAAFALGHPEKLIDMGYRAIHEMTVSGKAISRAFYDRSPSLSYFNGCSQGGRQAVTEAMRYPADYDGIIAGAPAIYNTEIHTGRMAINAMVHRSSDAFIPQSKFASVHDAVLKACDPLDGVTDGVIENPMACKFDPKTVQCTGADDGRCLTPAQVETMRRLYSSPFTEAQVKGSPAYLQPGTELGWATLGGERPVGTAFEAMKFIVFKDANWDAKTFKPATDIDRGLKSDPVEFLD
jgi:feruloyl esterase